MAFALSLALGIEGHHEVLELELDEELPPQEVHAAWPGKPPAGLEILTVRRVPRSTPGSAASRSIAWRCPPTAASTCRHAFRRSWPRSIAGSNARGRNRGGSTCAVFRDLRLSANGLDIELTVTPTGMARPDEIMSLLGSATCSTRAPCSTELPWN